MPDTPISRGTIRNPRGCMDAADSTDSTGRICCALPAGRRSNLGSLIAGPSTTSACFALLWLRRAQVKTSRSVAQG
jgi:hypothetical protein